MTLVLLPDAEKLVIRALLTLDELSGLNGRIYNIVPKSNRVFPLARVSRFAGDPWFGGDPYWIDHPMFQCDVWADRVAEGAGWAETLRACLAQRIAGGWPDGVISSVRVSALVQTTDPIFDPPKPRYRFTAQVVVHP